MLLKKIVTNIRYTGVLWDQFERACGPADIARVAETDLVGLRRELKNADVAILQALLPPEELIGANLKWLHVTHAGLDRVAHPSFLNRGIRVSGSAGYSVETLAEHALFFMLSLAYRASELRDSQLRQAWEKSGREHLRSLYGSTVGIIGLGHIGQALATRCRAMGMQVLGYRRKNMSTPAVDQLYSSEDPAGLDRLLEKSDYVVLALPLTDDSFHIINARTLGKMKSTAHLINIARGGVVDEDALITALKTGAIAGAGLDVFAQEPLPPSSPLWTLPNVIITPHTSPREPDRDQRAVDLICENLDRYRANLPLINELSEDQIFTHKL